MLRGKHILVGVTGGIAAYKSAVLVRLLVRSGASVRVVMTRMAEQFISPLTMATLSQHPVLEEMFDPKNGAWNSHIDLGSWADLYVIAPATANTIGKMVHGLADNLLTTSYLAARCPVMVAPAMDVDMYHHPAVQANLARLRERCLVVEPEEGFLASGLEGKGRMAEPEHILRALCTHFGTAEAPLQGRRVMVTSGPTREAIDPVRFLTNSSSGRMGTAICEALADLGAEVHCVSGPCEFVPAGRERLTVYPVETALQMHEQCVRLWPEMDAGVMAAAVSDYRPSERAEEKIRHKDEPRVLHLTPNPDIAKTMGTSKRADQLLVGFALETSDGVESAKGKLERKNLDLVILNSLRDPGAGFGTPTNRATLYYRNGAVEERPLESKAELGRHIARCLAKMLGGYHD